MRRLTSWVSPRLASWLAVGLSLSVLVLGIFAYRAVREWERTATLLAERRAQEHADMLVLALTRDMRGAQESLLSSQQWTDLPLEDSQGITDVLASTFARFPYPEAFFAWRTSPGTPEVRFFARPDRIPGWLEGPADGPLPVAVGRSAHTARALIERVRTDVAQRRRFSIFDLRLNDEPYQVVARLQYADPFREELQLVLGFLVNLSWARRHYFPEVSQQVARIAADSDGLTFTFEETGNAEDWDVTKTEAPASTEPSGQRRLAVAFFDPSLVVVDPPPDLTIEQWTIRAGLSQDPALQSAREGAQRTLTFVALGALGFALGLLLTVSSTRSHARLAQLRADFVSTVTHELKTPIATIRAAADTLISGRVGGEEGSRRYAQLMADESKHLTRLLDNLLAHARISDTADAYAFAAVEVGAMVDRAINTARSRLDAAGFSTHVDVPSDLPPVRADWTAIGLALDNVIDNAIRYSKDARDLHIGARREAGSVRIRVSDKGVGISTDELPHVTRRFFRGRSTAASGSGLGLAIVERIVRDHRGTLAIQSVAGSGTTVEIALPLWRG